MKVECKYTICMEYCIKKHDVGGNKLGFLSLE